MKVRVSFYSYFKDLTGCAEVIEAIPENSTLGFLHDAMLARFPRLTPFRKSTLCAVGLEYRKPDYVLQPGDEVAFFPPVQGG
jgi:molybdopterin converting factor small subunit